MRALVVLLLSTCLGSSAYALAPLATESPAPAAAAGTAGGALAIPTTINGKFVVGYEGRGDYLKNAQLEKQSGNPTKAAAAALPGDLALDTSGKPAAVPAAAPQPAPQKQAPANTAPAATTAKPAMRSDAALSNDSTKLKPAAPAPATTTAAAPAATAQPAAQSGINNPMVLVGGRIQGR